MGTVSPYFYSHNGEIWHEGAELGLPPQAKFCKKNRLRGYTPFGEIYTKNYKCLRFLRLYAHVLRVRTVKFGVSVRTLDTLSALNFVKKIAQKDLSLKFEIFAIFSYLSPYFYTNNVKIRPILKRTDRLRNPSKKQIFVKIAQWACRYCIASEMMHIDF